MKGISGMHAACMCECGRVCAFMCGCVRICKLEQVPNPTTIGPNRTNRATCVHKFINVSARASACKEGEHERLGELRKWGSERERG
jgi:hypothetical protein